MDVKALWRYPVKSMGGETIDACDIGTAGLAGDRAFAVIGRDDGRVASAKNPRKWGKLLEFGAAYVDGPGSAVAIMFPSGDMTQSDDPDIDARLSSALDRDVALVAVPPTGASYEADWPAIDGIVPAEFLAATRIGPGEEGGTMTTLPPKEGTFLDAAAVHLLAASTLEHLGRLAPASVFDQRRFRPNIVVGAAADGFVENSWMGSPVQVGDAVLQPLIPTMRCVMTTLAQRELAQDRGTLKAIAEHNKVEIPGLGTWSCAGLYAEVERVGRVRVGDPVVAG